MSSAPLDRFFNTPDTPRHPMNRQQTMDALSEAFAPAQVWAYTDGWTFCIETTPATVLTMAGRHYMHDLSLALHERMPLLPIHRPLACFRIGEQKAWLKNELARARMV